MDTCLYTYGVEQDGRLELGAEVTACWHDRGYSYRGRAVIVALQPQRLTVRLLETVGVYGEYPVGRLVELPRFSDQINWSVDHGVCRRGSGPLRY